MKWLVKISIVTSIEWTLYRFIAQQYRAWRYVAMPPNALRSNSNISETSMHNPLVSVVIPSYNHSKYIEKAVLSVIHQTYKNIELIVIDDGSDDGSKKILSDLSQKFNFQLISRSNKGLISTLNEALELASGEYFTMLGSDDYFKKNKIELQIDYFQNHSDTMLCYSNLMFIDADGRILKKGKTKHFKSGFVFKDLIYKNFIPLPTVMLKTSVVKEAGGFDDRFFLEDYPLWLKIAKNHPIGYMKDCLTYYRLHGNNVSGNLIKMIHEVEKILNDWKSEPEYSKSMNKLYYRWFCDLSKTDHKNETKKYMMKSLATSFFKPRFIRSYLRYHFNTSAQDPED